MLASVQSGLTSLQLINTCVCELEKQVNNAAEAGIDLTSSLPVLMLALSSAEFRLHSITQHVLLRIADTAVNWLTRLTNNDKQLPGLMLTLSSVKLGAADSSQAASILPILHQYTRLAQKKDIKTSISNRIHPESAVQLTIHLCKFTINLYVMHNYTKRIFV